MANPEDAKVVGECQFLGLEREGMTPTANPNVVGVGIGRKTVRGMSSEDLALKVYVKQKVHPLLVKDGLVIPDEVEGFPTDVEEGRRVLHLASNSTDLPTEGTARHGRPFDRAFRGDRRDVRMPRPGCGRDVHLEQ